VPLPYQKDMDSDSTELQKYKHYAARGEPLAIIIGGGKMENYLKQVMTFPEACKRWNLGESTLRKAARSGRFLEDELRKSEKTWLVTRSGMERLYGEEPEKKI